MPSNHLILCRPLHFPPSIFPSITLEQKKGHGHYLMVCCWCDPLQLSESWWNHYIWEVCSTNQWDALKTAKPPASIGQQKGPNSSLQQCHTTCHIMNASKVEQIGLQSFTSSSIFTWPLANQLPLLQPSRQSFCLEPAGGRKCFQEFFESWSTDIYAAGINLFLIGKSVLTVIFPILINKYVFEPSYNDLKFTVCNCNYFFINIILKGQWRHTLRMVVRLLSWTCMPQGAKNWNLLHTRAVLVGTLRLLVSLCFALLLPAQHIYFTCVSCLPFS